MPELPEVETVCRGLEKAMRGRAIARVVLGREGLRIPFPPGLSKLRDVKIAGLERRAKYILITLENSRTMIVHLGMSGRMTIAQDPAPQKHDHMVIMLDDGTKIVFNDPRRFGLVDLAPTGDIPAHRFFRHLGPEPLEKEFTAAYLRKALAGKKPAVKVAIMDQRVVVGVGNIYASESLFMAGIDPRRAAGNLSKNETARLAAAIRKVLKSAIAAGGSSLRDYVQASGELGYFQHSWAVYGKEGEKCRGPGCKGAVCKAVQAARATFYCPRCQK